MKKTMLIILSLTLLLLTACGEEQETTQEEQDMQDMDDIFDMDIGQEQQEDLPEVMATVNGNEITGEQFKIFQNQFAMQGMQLSTEEVLNQVIIREVLIQEAQEKFQITTEDIKDMLEEQGFTEETAQAQGVEFEEIVQQQLEAGETELVMLINEKKENIEVTEEEIQQVYEEQTAMGLEGSLEELRPEIENFIINNKADKVLLELADSLILESDIEIFY